MAPSAVSIAISVIRHAREAADYALTLDPYRHQLRYLQTAIVEHLTNTEALKQLYIDTNPVITGFAASLFLTPFFLTAAEVNRNYSQIDRFWSIIPTLYNVHWALWTWLSGYKTELLDLRLVVSIIWSVRLTYNYWRRGGYKIGSEDYRWLIIKNYIGQPAFFILDVLFIALGQNVLLFLVTVPSYISVLLSRLHTTNGESVTGPLDYLFTVAILAEIGMTWLADQQQWDYQTAKHQYQESAKIPAGCGFTAEQLELGFRTTGLWAYMRHPNFTFEQAIWWTFYLWSSVRAGVLLNWTIIGPILYSLVFQGSTPITEYITKGKYPEYKQYQNKVGCFFPKLGAKPPVFTSKSPVKKRVLGVNSNADTKARNEADYMQAKKRYDLR